MRLLGRDVQLYVFSVVACCTGPLSAWGLAAKLDHTLDAGAGGASALQDAPRNEPLLDMTMLDRFIIVPEIKLMFCYVEKVGCKNFNDLFRFYRSRFVPDQADNGTWKRNTFEVHNFTLEDITAAMVSDDWFKVLFFRDPLERFAAAWSSKCGGADKDGWKHCASQFGSNHTPFEETVKQVYQFDVEVDLALRRSDRSVNWTSYDPHWMRQSDFCGGLWKSLHHYNMVEKLERRTSRDKVIAMLKKVGVTPDSIPGFDHLFPVPEDTGWQGASHNTDTDSSLHDFFPREKPWLVETLMRHYSSDYNLFKDPPPLWAMGMVKNRLPWQLAGFSLPGQTTLEKRNVLPPDMVPPHVVVSTDPFVASGHSFNTRADSVDAKMQRPVLEVLSKSTTNMATLKAIPLRTPSTSSIGGAGVRAAEMPKEVRRNLHRRRAILCVGANSVNASSNITHSFQITMPCERLRGDEHGRVTHPNSFATSIAFNAPSFFTAPGAPTINPTSGAFLDSLASTVRSVSVTDMSSAVSVNEMVGTPTLTSQCEPASNASSANPPSWGKYVRRVLPCNRLPLSRSEQIPRTSSIIQRRARFLQLQRILEARPNSEYAPSVSHIIAQASMIADSFPKLLTVDPSIAARS